MAENRKNYGQWLAWLFRPEDSTGGISERNVWFEYEKIRCLNESAKHLGWIKTVFWIIAGQASAFLISQL